MFFPRRFILPITAAVVSALSMSPPNTTSTTTTKQIAPHVLLTQIVQTSPPELIDILTVSPSGSRMQVAPDVANGSLTNNTGDIRKGRESVAAYVSRTGVIAAVNGDYFPYTGDPLGLGILNGEIYSEPYRADDGTGRAAIGWLPSGRVVVGIPAMQARIAAVDGTILPITGIDRLTSMSDMADVCLITPRFGPSSGGRGLGTEIQFSDARPFPVQPGRPITATVTQIVTSAVTPMAVPRNGFVVTLPSGSPLADDAARFKIGGRAELSIDITDETPEAIGNLGGSWNRVRQAIGGGPILLRDGKLILDDAAEQLGGVFSTAPHARTAVGQKTDGTIVVATVDAGSALSQGISLQELAVLMQQQKVTDAINLDGGGSTTLAVEGGLTIDYPNGTAYERPVADLLTVRSTIDTDPMESTPTSPASKPPSISGIPATPVIGQSYVLSVNTGHGFVPGNDPRVIWNGPAGPCGFVSQEGLLRVTAAGHGTIMARVGGENVTGVIDVSAPVAIPVPPTPNGAPPSSTKPDDSSAGETGRSASPSSSAPR